MFYIELAKLAARQTVALMTVRQTRNFLDDHTSVNTDSIPLEVATMCVGEVVAQFAGPHTDKAVEKVVLWVDSKFSKKNAD